MDGVPSYEKSIKKLQDDESLMVYVDELEVI